MADNTSIGLTFTKTLEIRDGSVITDATIHIEETPYVLSHAKFLYIKMGGSRIETIAFMFFLASLGWLLNTLAKWLPLLFDDNGLKMEKGELIAPGIGFGIATVLYFFGRRFFTNNRTRIMKEIDDHFSKSEPTPFLKKPQK